MEAVLRYRYLFEQMVRRELRQKYKGSALGVLWYVVNPLVLMAAYWFLFGVVLRRQDIHDYPIFLMVGIVVWTFFAQSLLSAAPSLLEQASLVRKARFPREAIPASVVTVQMVTFLAVMGLFIPVAVAVRGTLDPALLLLPALVAVLYAFVLGCALAVAILHAYFRDVAPIVSAALLPWFFVTPIFFQLDTIGFVHRHRWAEALLGWVNPVAPFVEAIRRVVYSGAWPGWGRLAYVVAVAGLAVAGGRALFRRMEGELAVVV